MPPIILPRLVNLLAPAFLVALFTSLFFAKCSHDNYRGYEPTTGARMISGFVADTTKKPSGTMPYTPKIVYHNYKLEGSDTLFQLLWLQVNSPLDITPRDTKRVIEWLQRSIKIDSTAH